MSYITSNEFHAISLACDATSQELYGVALIDNGDGLQITTNCDTVKIVRYAGGCPFTYQAYVLKRLEELPVMLRGEGKHHNGTPVFDVMADAWLDGLLSNRPVRTPVERELGVIYG